jgi:hypothetical protein
VDDDFETPHSEYSRSEGLLITCLVLHSAVPFQSIMVCAKCEKKLSKVAAPDKWKEGSRNTKGTVTTTLSFCHTTAA